MKKILTVGEILVEIVATTKGEGFLEAQSLIGPFPSGAPAIFIDQIGRLGGAGGIISRVGNDDFGALNIRRLQADGIDVSAVEIAEGEATGSAFVRYREDGSRKFVFNIVHSAYGGLQMTAAAEALIADCEHLHIMGTALAAPQSRAIALHALQAVKSRGGSISFDPNIRAEMMGDAAFKQDLFAVLRQCDVFLPSGEELFLFTQAQEEAAAVAELLAQGVPEIVLKRGAQGAAYFSLQEHIETTAITVQEIDPTGAGDCFGAVFIRFWTEKASPHTALCFANAAGAYAVTQLGPMEGCIHLTDLEHFIAEHECR